MELSHALEATLTGQRPRFDLGAGALTGSRCQACGEASWPARAVCNRCGSADLEDEAFSTTATLLTHTTVWVPRPGLPAGYVLGQVRLDGGPAIFTHVRDLPEGAKVPLAVRLVLAGEGQMPPFWFEPAAAPEAVEVGGADHGR